MENLRSEILILLVNLIYANASKQDSAGHNMCKVNIQNFVISICAPYLFWGDDIFQKGKDQKWVL